MTIKSSVCCESPQGGGPQKLETAADIEHFREELLLECKSWFEEKMNQLRDR